MAKFLNSSGISYHIESLIKNANRNLFLISPYLKFNPKIKQLLEDRNRLRTIDIKIIYGKVDLQIEENTWLKSMDFIKVLCCKNLHAKCYMNEEEAIITSMNLYEFSQQNNNEMGIHITKKDDPELYESINNEVSTLIRISDPVSISIEKIKTNNKSRQEKFSSKKEDGYCIRCKDKIKKDTKTPLCKKCCKSWNKYADKTYEEKFCHICGKENKSSMEKPICYSCYKKTK